MSALELLDPLQLPVASGTGFVVTYDETTGEEKKLKIEAPVSKGDILIATEAGILQKLPIGSNGQVLTADSTEAKGAKWAAASSGIIVDTAPANEPTHAISSQWAYGVQGDRTGWREDFESKSLYTQASPTALTWYNLGSSSIGPFGASGEKWKVGFFCIVRIDASSVTDLSIALSEAAATAPVDNRFMFSCVTLVGGSSTTAFFATAYKEDIVTLTGAASYYLNLRANGTGLTNLRLRGDIGATRIWAQRIK
jgi:hypothetical protein